MIRNRVTGSGDGFGETTHDTTLIWAELTAVSIQRKIAELSCENRQNRQSCFIKSNPFTWWNISIITNFALIISLFFVVHFLALTKLHSVSFSWSAWLTFLLLPPSELITVTSRQTFNTHFHFPVCEPFFFCIFKSLFNHHRLDGMGKGKRGKGKDGKGKGRGIVGRVSPAMTDP